MSMQLNERYLGVDTALKAGATLEAGRFVKKDNEGMIIYTTAGDQCIGAIHQNVDSGDEVAVVWSGIVAIKVGSGGVSVNREVTSDATGQAVNLAPLEIEGSGINITGDNANGSFLGGELPSKSLGVALDDAAEGDMVRIRLK